MPLRFLWSAMAHKPDGTSETRQRPSWRRGLRRRGPHTVDLPPTDEAVIRLYAARTSGIRGAFAVHCWLVLKPPGGLPYERWDVVGARARTGSIGLQRNVRAVRDTWGGHRAELLLELRGEKAAAALERVRAVIRDYRHRGHYWSWPGPNCNSFVAHLVRHVPALRTALPALALGKDFLPGGALVAPSASGTGYQVSLLGLAGLTVAAEEGIEFSLLGLVLGFSPRQRLLKLPILGDVGRSRGGKALADARHARARAAPARS